MKFAGLFASVVIGAAILHSGDAAAAPTYRLSLLSPDYLKDELRVTDQGRPYLVNLSSSLMSWAVDRNTRGTMVGGNGWYSGNYVAVASHDAISVEIVPFSAAFPSWTLGAAVNEQGDILGGSTNGVALSMQIYTKDGVVVPDIGISYRRPSFNNRWDIVGVDEQGQAFYMDKTSKYALSSLVENLAGFSITSLTHINDAGYIAGYGSAVGGIGVGFILTPTVTVPEPTSVTLLALGGLVLGLSVGRGRKYMT